MRIEIGGDGIISNRNSDTYKNWSVHALLETHKIPTTDNNFFD